MKKTAIEVYGLLTCFVAMMFLSANLGIVIYEVVLLSNNDLILDNHNYKVHSNNDLFWENKLLKNSRILSTPRLNNFLEPELNSLEIKKVQKCLDNKLKTAEIRPPEKTLTKNRLASLNMAVKNARRESFKSMIPNFIMVLISSLLFFIHWRFVLSRKKS